MDISGFFVLLRSVKERVSTVASVSTCECSTQLLGLLDCNGKLKEVMSSFGRRRRKGGKMLRR